MNEAEAAAAVNEVEAAAAVNEAVAAAVVLAAEQKHQALLRARIQEQVRKQEYSL